MNWESEASCRETERTVNALGGHLFQDKHHYFCILSQARTLHSPLKLIERNLATCPALHRLQLTHWQVASTTAWVLRDSAGVGGFIPQALA